MSGNKMSDSILISEIFGPTLQGEGALVGAPTVFVRTGGCDFRCTWCDSLHAVLPENRKNWRKLSAEEVFDEVNVLTGDRPILVTISGGNPALMPLEPFIDLCRRAGFPTAMETQASRYQEWFDKLDHLILSPKPPSSGMPFDEGEFIKCLRSGIHRDMTILRPRISVKVVVMDEEDYQFARRVARLTQEHFPFFLTPGNHTPPNNPASAWADRADEYDPNPFDQNGLLDRTRWLAAGVVEDGWYRPRIIPQIHTLLWGNEQGK